MKKILIITIITVAILIAGCETPIITSFEECAAAGNPVMESHPRQCRANDQTFVEELPDPMDDQPIQLGYHECTELEKQSEICTMEYDPVCGLVDNGIRCVTEPCQSVDAKTFSNGCSACAAQAIEYYKGTCENQKFVVCTETIAGFDPLEFAENIGGICVDICPGNYDGYVNQIGVEQCISHYGLEEISSWQECTQSSADCSCVKTYETTDAVEITDAPYRCVPEQYESRMLFRAGVDKLDENGVQSVMIA